VSGGTVLEPLKVNGDYPRGLYTYYGTVTDNAGCVSGNINVNLTFKTGVANTTQNKSYCSIQAAIDGATAGDAIRVDPGTFTENININKKISLTGSGSGSDPVSNTIITQTGGSATPDTKVGVIQLNASGNSGTDPLLIKDLRLEPVGMAGISVGRFTEATGTSVAYVELDNVKVIGTNTNPSTEQERGLYVDLTSTLTYLNVVGCAFDNLTYGWYTQKQVSVDASTVQYITVENTTFNHNNHKGIYAEKMSDASFTTCTVDQNGYNSAALPSYFQAWSAGIDINLKAGIYANFLFDDCTVTNNAIDEAKEGVGLTVKARDDGGYATFSATVDNVDVLNSTITDNERGLRFGEPGKGNATPTNVTVNYNNISNNTQHYSGSDGSAYGNLINMTADPVAEDATCNWWGSTDPAVIAGTIYGNVTFLPFWVSITGPCTGVGPVANVTQGTSFMTIQAAINDAATTTGDLITVASGIYTEDVGVTKSLTIRGAGTGATYVYPTGTGPAFSVSVNNVIIEDLEITHATGLVTGIEVVSPASSGFTADNLKFSNFATATGANGYGINIMNSFTDLNVMCY